MTEDVPPLKVPPRLPPPSPISPAPGGRSPPASPSMGGERIPMQKMVAAAKETTPLVEGGAKPGKGGGIPFFDYDIYEDTGGGKTPKHLLLNFWASVIAVLASGALIGCSAYFLMGAAPSALFLSCIIGATLATLSLTVEFSHLLGCPRVLLFPLAQHAMFHLCVACFGVPAFLQKHYELGALFALHVVPSLLFFVARARREPSPVFKR